MTQDILMSSYDEPVSTNETGRNQLQSICSQAKAADGAALRDLVIQILESPNIYVFAEFLSLSNVEEMKDGPDAKYFNTLKLFAFGTFKEYKQNKSDYIELTPAMEKKLKQLTIISLAIKTKCIPYSILLEELEVDNVRHLEDVIIEAIYADIIHGKLSQNSRILEIDYAQGRDVPPGMTTQIAKTLQDWVNGCNTITNCIDEQIEQANSEKYKRLKNSERVEQEMGNLKKVMKTQMSDNDEVMHIDQTRDIPTINDTRKKALKTKLARPSGIAKANNKNKSK